MSTSNQSPKDDAADWLATAAERESWAALGQLLESGVPRIDEARLLERVRQRIEPTVHVQHSERRESSPPWFALAASVALLIVAGWGAIRSTDALSPLAVDPVVVHVPTTPSIEGNESAADDWLDDELLAAEFAAVETSIVLFEERMRTSAWEVAAVQSWLDDLERGWEQEGL